MSHTDKTLEFDKMHGLGNDFAIFDLRNYDYPQKIISESFSMEQISQLAERNTGIGFDQLILLLPESGNNTNTDCFMEIYNSDGTKAEACGNATRCVAKLIMQNKSSNEARIKTSENLLTCYAVNNSYDLISVNMGKPKTSWYEIPMTKEHDTSNIIIKIPDNPNFNYTGHSINIGNPHCVFPVEDLDMIDIESLGKFIENHEIFPQKTNVEFIKIIDKNTIRMKVWERGSGITKACGTGACASSFIAYKLGLTENSSKIIMDGGELFISTNSETSEINMQGDAIHVFHGFINV